MTKPTRRKAKSSVCPLRQKLRGKAAEHRDGKRRHGQQRTPSEEIGQLSRSDHRDHADHGGSCFEHEEARRVFAGEQVDPRQRENRDHVEQGKAGQRGKGADHDRAPFACQSAQRRLGLKVAFLAELFERGFDDAQPGKERDDIDREGAEEGIAPAPVEEVCAVERLVKKANSRLATMRPSGAPSCGSSHTIRAVLRGH
jgi:hypothetical protein